jgi:predicted enzyme related to lactoylglutathione lyase
MLRMNMVMINSEQPEALKDFYTTVLGEPMWQGGDFTGFGSLDGGLLIGPHTDVKGSNEMPARIMPTFEALDVAAEFDRIIAAGGRAIAPPYHPAEAPDGALLATVADPDGNYLQISSPMPEEM